ncbi:MAG: beta-glucuronidase [Clostridia bacterium]|nr:beta-glucuronidase [Clostridia bacterium]
MKQYCITPADNKVIREIDPRLMSYNVEMTEVTGGTFWKAYTPGQIAGTEEFTLSNGDFGSGSFIGMAALMQYYPPIDLYNQRLRELASKFGPVWVRVSGSWATKTYYDFDGTTGGKAPEGYQSVLTREQWIGVLDFVKAVDGKLLISVSNCAGDHPNGGPLDLSQTKKIFALSHEYGVDIDAAEFMNEPNMMEMSGAPRGYTAKDFARDQDIFNGWVKENYPNCLIVGPCTLGDGSMGKVDKDSAKTAGAGIGSMMTQMCNTDALMDGCKVPLDVFSYHYYNGVSERLASVMPTAHWDGSEAHSEAYLAVAPINTRTYLPLRDKYAPGGQIWVTESGDAGGGGDTWASTYLDVLRTLNELGIFATLTDGVIFHNTLASSDYGFLKHGTFEPRPNYFAVLLWNTLMGTTVYDCQNPDCEGAHIYCHSRKDGKDGFAYLVINNSLTEATEIDLPTEAEVYALSGNGSLRASVMCLNGKPLELSGVSDTTELVSEKVAAGKLSIAPASCTFIVI